jgi:MoaA/NifB/PqqE/SkfB family radical SAM enzyme
MPLPLVKRLLDEGREHALPAITLGLGSEPLLSPDLPAILSLCGKSGAMDIRLGTNGLLLGGAVSDSLLDSPLTRLEISVDAASPASYQAIRGGDYLSLLKNIDMFLEKREKLGRAFPLLRLSFLALSENRGELDAFLALWGERADMLSVQKPIWFPESRLPKPERPEPPPLAPCRQPWQRLSVLEDGSVWPCCSWYGEKLISKSAFNESVEDIWRGSEMRILRERLSDGAPPGPCQDCRAAGAF